jgi:hypothetical protein
MDFDEFVRLAELDALIILQTFAILGCGFLNPAAGPKIAVSHRKAKSSVTLHRSAELVYVILGDSDLLERQYTITRHEAYHRNLAGGTARLN